MELEQVLRGIGEGKFRVIYYDLVCHDEPNESFLFLEEKIIIMNILMKQELLH